MVERDSLENCYTRKGIRGSNPLASALCRENINERSPAAAGLRFVIKLKFEQNGKNPVPSAMDYKILFGVAAVVMSIIAYIPYVRDIFLGKTKPHAFSWFAWTFILAIVFAAQLVKGAGAGAWFSGFEVIACLFIFILAITRGAREFPLVDWFALCAALLAMYLWWLTKSPTVAIVLVSIADAIGFVPTFRKGFFYPDEETISLYALLAVGALCSIAALETYNIATLLYPASYVCTASLFVFMILLRRSQDAQKYSRTV